jgi:hypothetical protein
MSDVLSTGASNTANDRSITPGALRMRASRQRRRAGLRCITLDLRESDIGRLIELGHLRDAHRADNNKVLAAQYRFLDRSALGGGHHR